MKNDPSSQNTNNPDGQNDFKSIGELLLPYLQKLWLVRRKILIINGTVLILSIACLLLFAKPYYDSMITILPDYGNQSSSLSSLVGLAQMAGVSVGENADPSDIYANLLKSEPVVVPVLYQRYKTQAYSDSVDLFKIFNIEPDKDLPFNIQQRKMLLDLFEYFVKSKLNVSIETLTKIVTVRVSMPEPRLSADVVNALVQSLDNYVVTKRKSNAKEQTTYIEKRIAEIVDSLKVATNNLKYFQQSNNVISQSPGLALELSSLNLQVQILQGVYGDLRRQLEIAKIDEIRDAPIVNEREWAKEPYKKAGPPRLLILIAIMMLSLLSSSSFFLYRDKVNKYMNKIVENDPTSKKYSIMELVKSIFHVIRKYLWKRKHTQ
jgi:uncharacterized protein involved in exopolysaccharide biosynthesis